MEIAGHTDSQGGEQSNLALSQARAEAVLLGLQGRRVLVGALTAKGYGETRPIADNATEAGREANRRIEFTLLSDAATTAALAAEGATAAPDGSIDAGAAESAAVGTDDLAPTEDPGTGDGDPAATEDPGTGDGDPAATEDPGTGDGDPAAPEDPGTGDGDPAATEDPGTGDGDTAATEGADVAAPAVAEAEAVSPADATAPAPEEPFVSSAPAEQTRRPERRPESN